jgi:hypothetical protein
MYGYAQWLDRLVDENMIDSQHRKPRREGGNWSPRWNEFAHIMQMAIRCPIVARRSF